MLIVLLYPSRFSLTFTNTGVQTGLTSWGNCLPLFLVHPAISGWKYPLFAMCVFLLHLPECWAVPHRHENNWLGKPGSVAALGEMHRASSQRCTGICLILDSTAGLEAFARYFKGHPSAICWSSCDKCREGPW